MGSVAPFDSHSCAPSLFDRTAGGGAGCCSLSEPFWTAACDLRPEVSAKLKPVDPAQFLFGTKPMRPSVLCPPRLGWNRRSVPAMHSTPQLSPRLRHLGLFRPVTGAPNPSRTRAKKPRTRCLDRRTEWLFWHPLGATGGTRIHSRRTGTRLGQTRCARQGLVRVPESNTKYGGKRGKTGVDAAPVMGPSISES